MSSKIRPSEKKYKEIEAIYGVGRSFGDGRISSYWTGEEKGWTYDAFILDLLSTVRKREAWNSRILAILELQHTVEARRLTELLF